MKYLVVDDEQVWRDGLVTVLRTVIPDAEILTAMSGAEALALCEAQQIDVAFLDVEMPGMDGLTLETELKRRFPKLNSIMVTAYSEYAVKAIRQRVSGYLIKPVTADAVQEELECLRNPAPEPPLDALLKVRCYGFFEAWHGEEPLRFSRHKSKELLAYLIFRKGAEANTANLCAVLFEDDSARSKHYLRVLLSDLRDALRACGAEDVLRHGRNSFAVDPAKLDCDWYRAPHLIHRDGFMRQYTWAEPMNAKQRQM